jgi:hypothetical protein
VGLEELSECAAGSVHRVSPLFRTPFDAMRVVLLIMWVLKHFW